MRKSQSPTMGNPSDGYISCAHCGTSLPPQALYCSFCGQRVGKKRDIPATDTSAALILEEMTSPSIPAINHRAGASKLQRKAVQASPWLDFLWPVMIILSALATWLVNVVFTALPVRPLLVFWFLFFCPGMALVRFFRLREPVVEWMLALALSLSIDALVAGIQLYAGRWSTSGTLSIVIVLSLSAAIIQFITALSAAFLSKRPRKSYTK